MESSCALALGIPAFRAVRNAFLLFCHTTHVFLWWRWGLQMDQGKPAPTCATSLSPYLHWAALTRWSLSSSTACRGFHPRARVLDVFHSRRLAVTLSPWEPFLLQKTCLPWRSCADPPEVSSASVREFLEILCLCFSVVSSCNFTRLSRQLCCISIL